MRAVGWLALIGLFILVGCQPVKEDRHINWAKDGKAVGFQHGQEGVFVARDNGKGLEKVFQPGPNVLATSAPLWSPTDKRLIFTTAVSRDGLPHSSLPWSEENPAGNWHAQVPIKYTCWLREAPKDGRTPQPKPLFEATCDHVGYVAANLAVRWHPSGQGITFLQATKDGHHGVFQIDLATRQTTQVFPHATDGLLFDWTPDGSRLVCVLGSYLSRQTLDGIWIGKPEANQWRHTPTGTFPTAAFPSLIERLRATRPAWTADGSRFAYADYDQLHQVKLGHVDREGTSLLEQSQHVYSDFHWSPQGKQLGFLMRGEENHELILHEFVPVPRRSIAAEKIRRFLGWDSSGRQLACLRDERIPGSGPGNEALLLTARPETRQILCLQAEGQPAQEVLSGMQITFAQWSPKEPKLSAWLTFSPTHEWLLPLPWYIPPGDPAAIFDTATGQLHWMAVNPHEMFQVGHYYQRRKEYAQAWEWYAKAEKAAPLKLDEASTTAENLMLLRDHQLCPGLCLAKLGRQQEADQCLTRFRVEYQKVLKRDPLVGMLPVAQELLENPQGLFHDMYYLQVLLSLDAWEDAETYFRAGLLQAKTETEKIRQAALLAQVLLLRQRHSDFVQVVLEHLVPRAEQRLLDPNDHRLQSQSQEIAFLITPNLLPLFSAHFLATIPEAELLALCGRWEQHPEKRSRLLDQFLVLAYERLHLPAKRDQARERLLTQGGEHGEYTGESVKQKQEQFREARKAVRQLLNQLNGE